MMVLALGVEWLAWEGAKPSSAAPLQRWSPHTALTEPATVLWHPEQCSLGVAAFEGESRHAATLLERKLRAQGEISSDVKMVILETQAIGRGYQVLYAAVALEEWQHMLSWAETQQHIGRLMLVPSLVFRRGLGGQPVVLHVGRSLHFFVRHEGQLVHLQSLSVEDAQSDLEAAAAMLGTLAREEMAVRGVSSPKVTWIPAAFSGARSDLDAMVAAFATACSASVVLEAEELTSAPATSASVHTGLPSLAQRIRPQDLLNQGQDKLQVLAREYLPYGAMAAFVAALGMSYVGYGWMQEASALRQQMAGLQTTEASVRDSSALIARDTQLDKTQVDRQADTLRLLHKVLEDHDPVHLLNALRLGAQGGMRILSVSMARGSDGEGARSGPWAVVDGALPDGSANASQDTRALSRLVQVLNDNGYTAEPIDSRSGASDKAISTRLFSYRISRMPNKVQGGP